MSTNEYEETLRQTKSLWKLTLTVCENHMKEVSEGKKNLTGTLLNQVCSVLREGKSQLKEMEEEIKEQTSQEQLSSLIANLSPDAGEQDFSEYIKSTEKDAEQSIYGDRLELADSGWKHHGHSER